MAQDFVNRFVDKLIDMLKAEHPAYDGEISVTRAMEWADGYDLVMAPMALDLAIDKMVSSGDYADIQGRLYHVETLVDWRQAQAVEMMDALYKEHHQ